MLRGRHACLRYSRVVGKIGTAPWKHIYSSEKQLLLSLPPSLRCGGPEEEEEGGEEI